MPIAYALRADYEDSYTGGLLAVGTDRTINVREELDTGGGRIVVDENDEQLLTVLDHYPALKRTTADSAPAAGTKTRRSSSSS